MCGGEARESGLGLRHYGVLAHLSHSDNLSYSDLARRAGITAQSMHATVRLLEERGAVIRSLSGHGHAARLTITERGRELYSDAREAAEMLDAELRGDLNDDERADVRSALIKVAAAAERSGRTFISEG